MECVSETRRHCTQAGGVFPQGKRLMMFGKCSALGLPGVRGAKDAGVLYRQFAGRKAGESTGMSTPVENVRNLGTRQSHLGGFLLKMGKVVSGCVA